MVRGDVAVPRRALIDKGDHAVSRTGALPRGIFWAPFVGVLGILVIPCLAVPES
jgi:hypothetical protein